MYFIQYSCRRRIHAYLYKFRDIYNTTSLVIKVKENVKKNIKDSEFLEVILGCGLHYIPYKIIREGRNILIPDLNKINRDELPSLQLEKY